MATNEVETQSETGLIGRCKRINEKLRMVLELTIEITGQRYEEEKTNELDADIINNLLSWLQVIGLNADNLMTQLDYMKEQF